MRRKVLVLCTANSARSQMAEGLLRSLAGDSLDVASAGTSPTQVRPEAIQAMSEIGIDISSQRSKSVDEFAGQKFHDVITVCDHAREVCPVFPGARMTHAGFEDPAAVKDSGERLQAFRRVRDQLKQWLTGWLEKAAPPNSAQN